MLHTTLCSKQVELGHHTLQLLLAQTHEVIAGKLDELRKNKTVRRDGVLHVFLGNNRVSCFSNKIEHNS
jgi:hypothetical protein